MNFFISTLRFITKKSAELDNKLNTFIQFYFMKTLYVKLSWPNVGTYPITCDWFLRRTLSLMVMVPNPVWCLPCLLTLSRVPEENPVPNERVPGILLAAAMPSYPWLDSVDTLENSGSNERDSKILLAAAKSA